MSERSHWGMDVGGMSPKVGGTSSSPRDGCRRDTVIFRGWKEEGHCRHRGTKAGVTPPSSRDGHRSNVAKGGRDVVVSREWKLEVHPRRLGMEVGGTPPTPGDGSRRDITVTEDRNMRDVAIIEGLGGASLRYGHQRDVAGGRRDVSMGQTLKGHHHCWGTEGGGTPPS